ncbi:MAG: STAS domain-containing protein [Candidatus Dormibacteraeota bacterium]|nr:STAS domain-containing protein [Candidatus Dormibacteraeota bacterium]
MAVISKGGLANVLQRFEKDLLAEWVDEQKKVLTHGTTLKEDQLRQQAAEFFTLLRQGVQDGNLSDIEGPEWDDARQVLAGVSRSRALQGFGPSQTAQFMLSLKQPIFNRLRQELGSDPQAFADEVWTSTVLLDRLALYTTEVFQKGRDEVIARQQQEMLELSTPVVKLWDGILALPLIGALDSQRTQVVMESLLQAVVNTGATIAIIDITGVPAVDTRVAQHLLKAVGAARLMGADCIISGIRPQIAQTIVHLGVTLPDVITKANLADAFQVALARLGLQVSPSAARA